MKFIPLALIASVCAPVASLGLRSLRNRSPDKSNKGSEAEAVVAAAVVGERELLSTWCKTDTPVAWHPNYAEAWSTAKCIYTRDCDSPAYNDEEACCNGAYGGQVSGACKGGLVNPSTVPTKWYPDYVTSWAIAGCKNESPYPNYITDSIKFDTQLACCKGTFGGQTSGSCIAGLLIKPTMAPITAGGVGGKWYADYGVAWLIAGCKNTFPYPKYATMFYSSHLECCKGAFGGQMSNACLRGLPMAPTILPTAAPTSKPTAVPTSKPTSKPTFEPTVTPSITIISEVNATLTVGARRLGMPLFQAVHANYTNIFLETIQNILAPYLNPNESVLEVRILHLIQLESPPSTYFLQVVFQIFLKEKCSPGVCPTDETSTTELDTRSLQESNRQMRMVLLSRYSGQKRKKQLTLVKLMGLISTLWRSWN